MKRLFSFLSGRKTLLFKLLAIAGVVGVGIFGVADNNPLYNSLVSQFGGFSQPQPGGFDQNQSQEAQQTLSNHKSNYQNRVNELRNFNKDTHISALKKGLEDWAAILQRLESAVSAQNYDQYEQIRTQSDDASRAVDDLFSLSYNQQNLQGNINQALKEKPRQFKDIERQLKDLQRDVKKFATPPDLSKLQEYIGTLQLLLTDMQAKANTSTQGMDDYGIQDLSDQISNLVRDFDDTSQDFYNTINELRDSVNQQSRLFDEQRNLKDKERQLKDQERQFKEISRKIPADPRVKELSGMIGELKVTVEEIKKTIANNDPEPLEDLRITFDDLSRETWDLINELQQVENQANQKKDIERNLKDKTRMLKDMQRECKSVKCEGTPSGDALNELNALFEEMNVIFSSGEFEEFWNVNSEFDEMSRQFWDSVQGARMAQDAGRFLKDTKRGLKDQGRWLKDLERQSKRGEGLSPEALDELSSVYEQMEKLVSEAEVLFQTGDTEAANELLRDMDDLRVRFEDIARSADEFREGKFVVHEISNIAQDVEEGRREIEKLAKRGVISEEKAQICLSYLDRADEIIQSIKQGLEEDGPSSMEQLKSAFDELDHKVRLDCPELIDEEEPQDYRGFTEVYLEGEARENADAVFNRISNEMVDKIVGRLMEQNSAMLNNIFEKAGRQFADQIAKTLEATLFIPEEYQEELLSRKAELLEQVSELERLSARLSELNKIAESQMRELQNVQEQLASYNFVGEAGAEIQEEIDIFLAEAEDAGLSKSEVGQRIQELQEKATEAIEKSKEEKFKKRIIPFKDTDDNEWFTKDVFQLARKNIVSGRKDQRGNPTGSFDPSGQVRVGEILKMSLEASGHGQAEGEPALAQARNHWGRGYVKQAENLNLSIIKNLDNVDRPATRAEVVQVILEAYGIKPQSVSKSSFSDVTASHPQLAFIEEARERKLASGDSGKNTFRPDDGINRAEAAALTHRGLNILGEGE